MHSLKILLLGTPRIELDNQPLVFNRRKSLALLAYLAMEPGPHSRDTLAALLWPGYGQTSARSNLRRTLSLLNGSLGQGWLDVDRESIALPCVTDCLWMGSSSNVPSMLTTSNEPDSMDDERLVRLQQAASLYRDDFLSGFTLADSEPFDDWQVQQAESLRRNLAEALQCLAVSYQEYGELADANAHTGAGWRNLRSSASKQPRVR